MAKQKTDESILTSAAKIVGTAAGKIASIVGVAPEVRSASTNISRKGKLQKKHRSRLPRRKKKSQQRAAARHSASHRGKPETAS